MRFRSLHSAEIVPEVLIRRMVNFEQNEPYQLRENSIVPKKKAKEKAPAKKIIRVRIVPLEVVPIPERRF